jgi:hypothetical protein
MVRAAAPRKGRKEKCGGVLQEQRSKEKPLKTNK